MPVLPRRRPWSQWWVPPMAVVAVLCGVVTSLFVVVGQTVTRPSFYRDAMVAADVYERFYTEVLADPEVTASLSPVISAVPVDPSFVSSTLRVLVPPAVLQQMVDAVIEEVVRFLQGHSETIDTTVSLTPLVASIKGVVELYLDEAGRSALPELAATVSALRPAVERYLARVANDVVPVIVPLLGSMPADVEDVSELVWGLPGGERPPGLRTEFEYRLRTGDVNGAVSLVAPVLGEIPPEGPGGEEEAGRVMAATGHRLERTSTWHAVVSLRRVTAHGPLLGVMVGTVGGLCAAALAVAARRRDRHVTSVIGALLTSVGVADAALWTAAGRLSSPSLNGIADRAATLPRSARSVMDDVGIELLASLERIASHTILTCTVAGAVLVLFGPLCRRLRDHEARTARITVALVVSAAPLVLTAWPVSPADFSGASVDGATVSRTRRCNGSVELCERPYDRAVQAGAHNAMAAADYQFLLPAQDKTITEQLEHGVRALMLDTYDWTDESGAALFTAADLPAVISQRLEKVLAMRVRARDGSWLCHNRCAAGALPLADGLDEVAAFMDSNPDEIVTIIFQDAISPAATEEALVVTGLMGRVLTPPAPGAPWPTLGRMIEEGTTLVVFAESARDAQRPWYPNLFDHAMDTPFDASQATAPTCRTNRGGTGKGLLIMNHWVQRGTAPSREDAAMLNQADVVVDRAHRCAADRGRLPTVIAADFVGVGDLVEAVEHLNTQVASRA